MGDLYPGRKPRGWCRETALIFLFLVRDLSKRLLLQFSLYRFHEFFNFYRRILQYFVALPIGLYALLIGAQLFIQAQVPVFQLRDGIFQAG